LVNDVVLFGRKSPSFGGLGIVVAPSSLSPNVGGSGIFYLVGAILPDYTAAQPVEQQP
jgi:hypothetical protein